MKKRIKIEIGNKYGRLTCLSFHHTGNHYRSYYSWKCDCGEERVILGSGVTSGNTKSCGCYGRETRRAQRLPDDAGVINHLVLQYKRHANDRGLVFRLSRNRFEELIRGECYYCGSQPNNLKITKNCKEGFRYNGIDRIDSKQGYVAGNVVSACSFCNNAKRSITVKEFQAWAIRLGKRAMADQWG